MIQKVAYWNVCFFVCLFCFSFLSLIHYANIDQASWAIIGTTGTQIQTFPLKQVHIKFWQPNVCRFFRRQWAESQEESIYGWALYNISLYWLCHFCWSIPAIPWRSRIRLVYIVYLSSLRWRAYIYDNHCKSLYMHGLIYYFILSKTHILCSLVLDYNVCVLDNVR